MAKFVAKLIIINYNFNMWNMSYVMAFIISFIALQLACFVYLFVV